MAAYPSLKRILAAGLTCLIVGVPVIFVVSCNKTPAPPIAKVAPTKKDDPVALPKKDAPAPPTKKDDPVAPTKKDDPVAQPVVAKSSAQDWPMYGGTQTRNMVNLTAKGLPEKWDVEGNKGILWVADLGSKAYGGPTVAGGRVFVGTNNQNPRDKKWGFIDPKTGKLVDLGVVMCFNEKSGKFEWQCVFEKLPGGLVSDWPYEGICSSPTVDGEHAYFVSNRCEVVCVDVKTGQPVPSFADKGKLDMIGKLGVFPHNLSDCSPLLVGNDLWVVTSNGVNENHIDVPAPAAPSFIKVDKNSGKILWRDNSPSKALLAKAGKGTTGDFFKTLIDRGQLIQHGQWSNPAHAMVNGSPQIIFPGGDGWIYSFDPQGELIWRFDCNPKDAKYALKTGARSDFIATPVIYKDKVYIGIGQDPEHRTGVGHLWCIDMTKKGDVSPDLVTDNSVFPPKTKPNPNSAKVWHYGGVCTPEDQKKLKRNYYFGRTMSTCSIHDDLVYVAELGGRLHCLDAKTGKVHWEYDTKSDIWSSPYVADGKIYLGTDDGVVFVFAAGKEKKLLAENDMGGRVRATPVAANGVLFVMTENKLYAIKK